MPPNPWLVTWAPRPAATLRLLCLAPAGGAATAFRDWPAELPPHVEVVAVELPGRGLRHREAPPAAMEPVVAELCAAVRPLSDRPLAVFGHSLGALIGLELAHGLRAAGLPEPRLLTVAACPAPQRAYARPRRPEPSEQELVAALREQGGVPARILADDRYRARLLGPLRADVALVETFTPPRRPPLTARLHAYWAADDAGAGAAEVAGWQAETSGDFGTRRFPGGHLFPVSARAQLLGELAGDLRAILS
ncbi:thioesterase [Actinoplanes sp. L3-i22]|nr:thioesterase [Actinoplanes sp. L3-i22]